MPSRGTPGFWLWLLQRFSGLLLIVFVALHGWFTHFAQVGNVETGSQAEAVTFEVVSQRLAQGFFVFFDFALLALVLYHGLNGIRGILLEWRPASRRQREVTVGLWMLGLMAFIYGGQALLVFVS